MEGAILENKGRKKGRQKERSGAVPEFGNLCFRSHLVGVLEFGFLACDPSCGFVGEGTYSFRSLRALSWNQVILEGMVGMRMPLQDNAVLRANLTEFQISRVLLLHSLSVETLEANIHLGSTWRSKAGSSCCRGFEPEY